MVKINPSLMFSGACGGAFHCYASLCRGEIVYMRMYAESSLAREARGLARQGVVRADALRRLKVSSGDGIMPYGSARVENRPAR